MNNEERFYCRITLDDGLQDLFCSEPEGTVETCSLVKSADLDG